MENSIVGSENGVTVAKKRAGFEVSFGFDRQLAKLLREVDGVDFDSKASVYKVPLENAESLNKVIPKMRSEFKAIEADLESINKLALTSALAAQRANNVQEAQPQISAYREPGKFYAGEIVNANARYAAQLTGHGKDDGAAFVVIHRLADLDRTGLMKGDRVGIKYSDKYQGSITDLSKSKSADELSAEFDKQAGVAIDGVSVSLSASGEHVVVAFDMNPVMLGRIKRVDGAQFNQEAKGWVVPVGNKEFALRAAHEMREEFVLDAKEVEMLREVAATKIDSAKVSRAFTKDGMEFFGAVVAVSDRYAMQKGGQDRFTLHHLSALSEKPEREQNISVKYNKGIGTVVDLDKQKEANKALGVGR